MAAAAAASAAAAAAAAVAVVAVWRNIAQKKLQSREQSLQHTMHLQ